MKLSSKAFTFIEVIFVVIVLGILLAIAIPKPTKIDSEKNNAQRSQQIHQTKPTNEGPKWN